MLIIWRVLHVIDIHFVIGSIGFAIRFNQYIKYTVSIYLINMEIVLCKSGKFLPFIILTWLSCYKGKIKILLAIYFCIITFYILIINNVWLSVFWHILIKQSRMGLQSSPHCGKQVLYEINLGHRRPDLSMDQQNRCDLLWFNRDGLAALLIEANPAKWEGPAKQPQWSKSDKLAAVFTSFTARW